MIIYITLTVKGERSIFYRADLLCQAADDFITRPRPKHTRGSLAKNSKHRTMSSEEGEEEEDEGGIKEMVGMDIYMPAAKPLILC